MTKKDIYNKLNKVFRDIFDDEDLIVNDDTTADDIEDWDSLEHINLCVAIEKKFEMKFTMAEVNNFKNVGDMVRIILEKTKSREGE